MTQRLWLVMAAGAALMACAGTASAQQNIDIGSSSYFGGDTSYGGYYNTFGENGGWQGNSGFGTYRRTDAGSSSTTATTGTIATVPFPGGADPQQRCSWLRHRAAASHQRVWRQRYAACLKDYAVK